MRLRGDGSGKAVVLGFFYIAVIVKIPTRWEVPHKPCGGCNLRKERRLSPCQYDSFCWSSVTNSKFQKGWLLAAQPDWGILAAQDCPEQDRTSLFTDFVRWECNYSNVFERCWYFIQLLDSISSTIRTDNAVISCLSLISHHYINSFWLILPDIFGSF